MTNFRKVFSSVPLKSSLNWFPKHMNSGLKQMQAKLRSVDCVVEIHDARMPLSGRNPNFSSLIVGNKPHILVFNKRDLIHRKDEEKILDVYKKNEPNVQVTFTSCKNDTDQGMKRLLPTIVSRIEGGANSSRDYHAMIIGVPNVGKSSLINMLRSKNLRKSRAVKVGPSAGVTKTVHEKVRISESPSLFLFDTPGVLPTRILDASEGLKIALCGNLPDAQLDLKMIADFLLFTLNRLERFKYVEMFGLGEPSDCILTALTLGSAHLHFTHTKARISGDGTELLKPDLDRAALYFITEFRKGNLGKILLDDLQTNTDENWSKKNIIYDE